VRVMSSLDNTVPFDCMGDFRFTMAVQLFVPQHLVAYVTKGSGHGCFLCRLYIHHTFYTELAKIFAGAFIPRAAGCVCRVAGETRYRSPVALWLLVLTGILYTKGGGNASGDI